MADYNDWTDEMVLRHIEQAIRNVDDFRTLASWTNGGAADHHKRQLEQAEQTLFALRTVARKRGLQLPDYEIVKTSEIEHEPLIVPAYYVDRLVTRTLKRNTISVFANRQTAATFTLDLEIDWSEGLRITFEFTFGIGFQAGVYVDLIIGKKGA